MSAHARVRIRGGYATDGGQTASQGQGAVAEYFGTATSFSTIPSARRANMRAFAGTCTRQKQLLIQTCLKEGGEQTTGGVSQRE